MPDADADAVPNAGVSAALVEELCDRVRFLENQLQQANERDRENRRIVVALTSRIPELEAAQERPEAPETVEEKPEGSRSPGPRPPVRRRAQSAARFGAGSLADRRRTGWSQKGQRSSSSPAPGRAPP